MLLLGAEVPFSFVPCVYLTKAAAQETFLS